MTNWMISPLLFLTTIGSILCQSPTLECYEGETKDLAKDFPNGLKKCKPDDGQCYVAIILNNANNGNSAGLGVSFGCGQKSCKPFPGYFGVQCEFSNNLNSQTKTISDEKDKMLATKMRRCHMMSESKDAPKSVYCPDGKCGWSASSEPSRPSFQGCSSHCNHLQSKGKELGFKHPCEECSDEDMCNNSAKVAISEEKAKKKPKGGHQMQPVSLLTGLLAVIAWAFANG